MNIASVETFPLFYPLKRPYGDANGFKHYRSLFLFRITTQSGIVGWGECADWLPVLKKGFEDRIIPYLIGKPALNRLELVNHIQQWHQRAAAGVSMALTEIAAKYAGLSICDLWGGSWRNSIPVYASIQSYSDREDWEQHSLDLVEKAAISGFNQVKVKVGGKTFKEDRSHIQKLQGQFSGSCDLILDANQSYDLAAAREWEKVFSKSDNFLWFEEPLPMNRVEDYKMLRSSLSVPLAGGENLKNSKDFLPLLREGALDITQPDPSHEVGMDEYRQTLSFSRSFGIRTSPHTYDGALSRLYALFAQACLPPWSKMEKEDIEPVEWDVMDNPFTSITPVQAMAGKVTIPVGTGIGLELDEQILKRYRWDGALY
ncbi:mandelate racemase/muconate lactonizing enzyme family protein [Paenibacillus sp. DMB20]|uniref:mandelate racemase/muconate lactonizing enzyme family protein n=1 Tax=Paenibacillus sp. DMB20 TaxID=1642570 RepID=UPI000627ABC6|nr:mandelate racemase/muconate lactonizing enzyme family protein [Paenibacillus sp. DMB20]KKO52530.1 isomerase [Paenibacillus sp. DMB20]